MAFYEGFNQRQTFFRCCTIGTKRFNRAEACAGTILYMGDLGAILHLDRTVLQELQSSMADDIGIQEFDMTEYHQRRRPFAYHFVGDGSTTEEVRSGLQEVV